jgi:hypothetical protein
MNGDMNFDCWADRGREPSIAIELFTLVVSKKQCTLDIETIVVLSLHALDRCFERSVYRETDDVLSDLQPIVKAADALLLQCQPFTIDLDHGCWLGETMDADFLNSNKAPKKVVAVRTFVSADMAAA